MKIFTIKQLPLGSELMSISFIILWTMHYILYLLFSMYDIFYDKIVFNIFYLGINVIIEEKHILENILSGAS